MKKLMSLILALLMLMTGIALAETWQPKEEAWTESVTYLGDGVFIIDFIKDIPWRTQYLMTLKDASGNPLTYITLGGDASEAVVQVQGEIAVVFIEYGRGNNGILPAGTGQRGKATVFCAAEEHFFRLEALLVQLFGKSQTPVLKRLQAFLANLFVVIIQKCHYIPFLFAGVLSIISKTAVKCNVYFTEYAKTTLLP